MMMNPNRFTLKFTIDASAVYTPGPGGAIGVLTTPFIVSVVVWPPAFGTNRPAGSEPLMSVCQSNRASILSGSCLLRSFGTSGPASDVAIVRMSDSLIPPRIVAPLKNSVGSNVFPMTVASLSSTVSPPAGRLRGDGSHHARETLNRHARRRQRAERVALHLVAELESVRLHRLQEDLAGVLVRAAPKPFSLYRCGIFDFGDRIRLLEQPLDGGDADVRALHLRVELRLRLRDARHRPDGEGHVGRRQARIAFRSGFDRRVADVAPADRRRPPRGLEVVLLDDLGHRPPAWSSPRRRRTAAAWTTASARPRGR